MNPIAVRLAEIESYNLNSESIDSRIEEIRDHLNDAKQLDELEDAKLARRSYRLAERETDELYAIAHGMALGTALAAVQGTPEFIKGLYILCGKHRASYWENNGMIRLYIRGGNKADYVYIRGQQGYGLDASARRQGGVKARECVALRAAVTALIHNLAEKKLSNKG